MLHPAARFRDLAPVLLVNKNRFADGGFDFQLEPVVVAFSPLTDLLFEKRRKGFLFWRNNPARQNEYARQTRLQNGH